MEIVVHDEWSRKGLIITSPIYIEIDDELKDDFCTIDMDGGVDANVSAQIDRAQAQQIVDHLTRVFSLEKKA